MGLVKAFIGKYALYALLGVLVCLALSTYTFYKKSSQNAAQLVLEVSKNTQLSDELSSKKAYIDKLTKSIVERDKAIAEAQRQAKEAQRGLNDALNNNQAWSDSTVPDDVSNSLRQRLR